MKKITLRKSLIFMNEQKLLLKFCNHVLLYKNVLVDFGVFKKPSEHKLIKNNCPLKIVTSNNINISEKSLRGRKKFVQLLKNLFLVHRLYLISDT